MDAGGLNLHQAHITGNEVSLSLFLHEDNGALRPCKNQRRLRLGCGGGDVPHWFVGNEEDICTEGKPFSYRLLTAGCLTLVATREKAALEPSNI